MKKTAIAFLSLALASLTACTKEEEPTTKEASPEGKWVYESFTHTKAGTTGEAQPVSDPECEAKSYFILGPGGTLEQGNVASSTAATDACQVKKIPGTWKIEDQELKMYTQGKSESYTIVSVSATEFYFKFSNPMAPSEFYTFKLTKAK